MTATAPPVISVELPEAFDPRWARLPGIEVHGKGITIDPAKYFFRFDSASWLVCDWEHVRAELLDATGLAPVWCSSWRADASGLIGSRLGLPAWPHVPLPRLPLTTSHPDGYLWKRDHVAIHAAGAPFAWIDDDFTDVDHAWAEARTAAGHPTLLVQPEHCVGILPEHLHAVRAWAAAGNLRRSA